MPDRQEGKGSEKVQIAVCDDEKEIRDMFAEKIKRFYPKADLLLYASGEELLLSDSQPDILLLDIQMPGKNGMETAKELRKNDKKAIIIFVTALEISFLYIHSISHLILLLRIL